MSQSLQFRHKAIYGMTGMGKTWLMKRLARQLRKHKQKVIVYSGVGDLDWPKGCIVTFSVDKLEQLIKDKKNQGAHIMLDEARVLYHNAKPKKHPHINNLFTMGRHRGYTLYVATQYPTSIPPHVRVNCPELYCFRLGSREHAKLVREDFGDVEYNGKYIDAQILKLDKLQHFHIIQPDSIRKQTL